MNYNILENLLYCKDIVQESLSALLYAHLPTAVVVLFLGIFVYVNARKVLTAKIFFFICSSFFIWAFLNLSIWLNYDKGSVLMYAWSLIETFSVILFMLSFYFSFVFVTKFDLPSWAKLIITVSVIPVILLASTKLNLMFYDIGECIALENSTYLTYVLLLKIVFTALTVIVLLYGLIKKNFEQKKEIAILSLGIIGFLFAFLISGKIGEITGNYFYEIYGLFAMFLFIGALTHLIVKFKVFNIRLFSVQVLVSVLVVIVGAQFAYVTTLTSKILASSSLVFSVIFGLILIKSVKNTIRQKEELQKINIQLKDLIQQRESLVHLITHKVKGSFTRTKYVFAEMLNDSFGVLTPEMRKMATTGLESDDNGIKTIDMVLNASNLQNGAVKYDMKKIDLKEIVLKVIGEKSSAADSKGLKIEKEINDDMYSILGDAFWLKEVINNFIDNSIKYTKSGTINIGLKKENNKIIFYVKDTGVGITGEDMKNLFTEGGRGKDSVKVNVDSTGYGLFSVKLIMDAHGGRVWAESQGKDQGSTFFAELSAI